VKDTTQIAIAPVEYKESERYNGTQIAIAPVEYRESERYNGTQIAIAPVEYRANFNGAVSFLTKNKTIE
jgi:hypothetical protein